MKTVSVWMSLRYDVGKFSKKIFQRWFIGLRWLHRSSSLASISNWFFVWWRFRTTFVNDRTSIGVTISPVTSTLKRSQISTITKSFPSLKVSWRGITLGEKTQNFGITNTRHVTKLEPVFSKSGPFQSIYVLSIPLLVAAIHWHNWWSGLEPRIAGVGSKHFTYYARAAPNTQMVLLH